MINNEKYVKVIINPLEKAQPASSGVNNLDITFTVNGIYNVESPYTGYGTVTVDVPQSSGIIEPLSVTPTTSAQTITASGGVDGYSPISVAAVTATIDNNIIAGNIKSGVSILGVTGNVVELNGEIRTESITSTSGNTFTPSSGKNGITSITITPNNFFEGYYGQKPIYEVVASTSAQIIDIPEGYSGFANIFCDGVDASIDSNIVASNIKDGVTILGVTGTYTGGGGSLPYPFRRLSINADTGYLYASDLHGTTSGLELGNNTITSVGPYVLAHFNDSVTLNEKQDFHTVTSVGDYSFVGAYSNGTINNDVDFTGLTTITGSHSFEYCFYGTRFGSGTKIDFSNIESFTSGSYQFSNCFGYGLTSKIVRFDSLHTVSSSNCFYYGFYNMFGDVYLTSLKKVSSSSAFYTGFARGYSNGQPTIYGLFDTLEEASGSSCFSYAFSERTIDTVISFSKLSTLTGSGCFSNAFRNNTGLTTLSFPALTSTSFGSNTNQFNSMLYGCTGVTVHFPSNLQSVIGSWTSVTSGFGGTNTTVLYDLPATT